MYGNRTENRYKPPFICVPYQSGADHKRPSELITQFGTAQPLHAYNSTLAELSDMFQGLEAMARTLSTDDAVASIGGAGSDLIAYCMTMAREAHRGYMLAAETLEGKSNEG